MVRPELEEFRERARGLRRRTELDAVMLAVLEAFDVAGVQSLVLKGPALARLLYTADEHRGYEDVDLLVAPGDLQRARGALAGMGYANASEPRGIDDVAGILHDETWVQGDMRDWVHTIDLHWRLAGCEAPPPVIWSSLVARRTAIDVKGREVAVLDREGLALHLATHAAQHGPRDVKAMGDLARGLERWPEAVWAAAAQLAREVGAVGAFGAGLRLLPAGGALARDLGLPANEELAWLIDHRDSRPRGTFHLGALAEARNGRERAGLAVRSLAPTRAWIVWEYPSAARGRGWLVAGYVRHLSRAPVWAARAWHFRRRARRAGSRHG